MASLAMGFDFVERTRGETVFDGVLGQRHESQVIHVAAAPVSANVIDYQVVRNLAIFQFPHVAMDGDGAAPISQANLAIALFGFATAEYVASVKIFVTYDSRPASCGAVMTDWAQGFASHLLPMMESAKRRATPLGGILAAWKNAPFRHLSLLFF